MGALFSRPKEADYDTVLAKLQTQIAARQARLQQIRLRERRLNALLITYGLVAWILYTVLWYFGIVGVRGTVAGLPAAAAGAAPVVLGPVAIIFTRRASRWFYHRKQDKEETQVKVLVKQKQDKVEEIKKKTGYYSTRDLLEKYDEALRKGPSSAPSTPAKQQAKPGAKPTPVPFPGSPSTPQAVAARPGTPAAAAAMTPQQRASAAILSAPGTPAQLPFPPGAAPTGAFPPAPFPPASPQPRTLLDKVADALLGVSPEDTNPMNRYALICGQCYAHNGLAKKDEFDFVQYRCPRCGHFNPPRRAPASASLSAGDPHRHRRVVSEAAPSPLSLSSTRPWGVDKADEPREVDEDEDREGEMREVSSAATRAASAAGRAGEKEETSTTALKEGGEARRRRRKDKVDADEDDRMDVDGSD
ncbi:hypothetical protein JCM3775_000211 [Rhodotorula graminis]